MEGSGSGSILIITDTDPGGPKSYGSYELWFYVRSASEENAEAGGGVKNQAG
jgi:hypothetical protein